MVDLVDFLDENGYLPTRDGLEAIMRRCDHDADGSLSFEEFSMTFDLEVEDTTATDNADLEAVSDVAEPIGISIKNLDKRREYFDKQLDQFYQQMQLKEHKQFLNEEA